MAEPPFWFGVEVPGVLHGAFSKLAISSELRLLKAKDDESAEARRIRPTAMIERRHSDDLSLFAWHQSAVDGPLGEARKDCTITVFDANGSPVARYVLEKAWPLTLAIGSPEPGTTDLTEAATLLCESLRRVAL